MSTYSLKNSKTLIVREALLSDAAELIEYVPRVVSETDFLIFAPGEFVMTVEEEEAFLEDFLATDNKLFLVAEVDGRIVGAASFEGATFQRLRHTGEMGITLFRDYWSLGIGTILIAELIKWARQAGMVRKINLRVQQDNHRAIALYERMGFVREGVKTRELCVEGHYYDMYMMGLTID